MYVLLENKDIARVDVSEIREVEEVFPVGSRAPIRAESVDRYTLLITASLAWDLTQIPPEEILLAGEIRSGVVSHIYSENARCLLANRAVAFVRKDSVLRSASEGLDKYLHLGDVVEVKITSKSENPVGTYQAEFIRRVERYLDDETGDSTLLDLAAIRQKGTTGGFSRNAAFRRSVLDAYDNLCCICGNRYVVHESTPMEAAHVVPRSSRGSNHVQNALCMCPTHHWAFDRGLITIEEDLSINVAGIVLAAGDTGKWLADLRGEAAYLDENAPVSRQALEWHRQNIFLDG